MDLMIAISFDKGLPSLFFYYTVEFLRHFGGRCFLTKTHANQELVLWNYLAPFMEDSIPNWSHLLLLQDFAAVGRVLLWPKRQIWLQGC